MTKKFPLNPAHPERNCWGCDKYCPAGDMQCGNGSDRTQHPSEIFGDDWDTWGLDPVAPQGAEPQARPRSIIPLAPVRPEGMDPHAHSRSLPPTGVQSS